MRVTDHDPVALVDVVGGQPRARRRPAPGRCRRRGRRSARRCAAGTSRSRTSRAWPPDGRYVKGCRPAGGSATGRARSRRTAPASPATRRSCAPTRARCGAPAATRPRSVRRRLPGRSARPCATGAGDGDRRADERQDQQRAGARTEQQPGEPGDRTHGPLRPTWPPPPADRQGAALSGADDGEQADDEQRARPRELGSAVINRIQTRAATPQTAPPNPKATTIAIERSAESRAPAAGAANVRSSINGDDPACDATAGVSRPERRAVGSGDAADRVASRDVGEVVRPGMEDHGPAGDLRRLEPAADRTGARRAVGLHQHARQVAAMGAVRLGAGRVPVPADVRERPRRRERITGRDLASLTWMCSPWKTSCRACPCRLTLTTVPSRSPSKRTVPTCRRRHRAGRHVAAQP